MGRCARCGGPTPGGVQGEICPVCRQKERLQSDSDSKKNSSESGYKPYKYAGSSSSSHSGSFAPSNSSATVTHDIPKPVAPPKPLTVQEIWDMCLKLSHEQLNDFLVEHPNITVPNGVSAIPYTLFENCTNLNTVCFPDSLTKICTYAFRGCKNLQDVVFPERVEIIESSAFMGCHKFKEIRLPSHIKIGNHAFFACGLGKHHIEFINDDLSELTLEDGAFEGCENAFSPEIKDKINQINRKAFNTKPKKGCYVASCVYGSYDCPEVWALRRFRDYTLDTTWYGRAFISTYYAISPTLIKWFGKTKWFNAVCKKPLDRMVKKLLKKGYTDTPYRD